jgi:hypothetical protein
MLEWKPWTSEILERFESDFSKIAGALTGLLLGLLLIAAFHVFLFQMTGGNLSFEVFLLCDKAKFYDTCNVVGISAIDDPDWGPSYRAPFDPARYVLVWPAVVDWLLAFEPSRDFVCGRALPWIVRAQDWANASANAFGLFLNCGLGSFSACKSIVSTCESFLSTRPLEDPDLHFIT